MALLGEVSADASVLALTGGTSVSFSLAVPNQSVLLGCVFFQQAAALGAAANPAGIAVSNSVMGVVGAR